MSNTKLSVKDKNEIEKFMRSLAVKFSQVIVQSRLGEKIHTSCNPLPRSTGSDWFNIAILDQVDVLQETKRVLTLNTGDSIVPKLPLCVEISLKTVEGDKMILEVWSLGILPDQKDAQKPNAIYNRMGILLKSLISVTRSTPAYKLSRRQSADSYSIYYNIYVGDPHINNLGEGTKQVRVGELSTIFGTLKMAVAYRTKMTISPTQTGRDQTIMLKSDHFLKDLSPKHNRYHHIKKNENKVIDLDKPLRPGAFTDTTKLKQYTEEDYTLPETPPFSWLLKKTKEGAKITEEDIESSIIIGSPPAQQTQLVISNQYHPSMAGVVNNNNATAVHNNMDKHSQEIVIKTPTAAIGSVVEQHPSSPTSLLMFDSYRSSRPMLTIPPEDERLMKELHFPFATQNTPISDLAKFYRECFNAPQLQEFTDSPNDGDIDDDVDEDIDDDNSIDALTKQLEQFEISLNDFDSLVTNLCNQSVDNNSNC